MSQNPQATMVAGFGQWQAKGRQVRKGEKSIKIFGYREKRSAHDDDQKKATEDDEHVVRYFPTLSVFDISQTDPIEGAEPLPEDPVQRLIGDNDRGLIAPLTAHLTGHGWSVHRESLSSASGYTDPESRRVILAEDLAPELRLSFTRPRTSSCATSTTSTTTARTADRWRSKPNPSPTSSPASAGWTLARTASDTSRAGQMKTST